MTTRTRLPFRLLSPEALSAGALLSSVPEPVSLPLGVLLVPPVPPQPASRPTAMDADRSRAISFLNFIVHSFLSFSQICRCLHGFWVAEMSC